MTHLPSPCNKSFIPTEQCLQDQGEVQRQGESVYPVPVDINLIEEGVYP